MFNSRPRVTVAIVAGLWGATLVITIARPFSDDHGGLAAYMMALSITASIAVMLTSLRRRNASGIDQILNRLPMSTEHQLMHRRYEEVARIWYAAGVLDTIAGREKADPWAQGVAREMRQGNH